MFSRPIPFPPMMVFACRGIDGHGISFSVMMPFFPSRPLAFSHVRCHLPTLVPGIEIVFCCSVCTYCTARSSFFFPGQR